jgi:hypothetical protein
VENQEEWHERLCQKNISPQDPACLTLSVPYFIFKGRKSLPQPSSMFIYETGSSMNLVASWAKVAGH